MIEAAGARAWHYPMVEIVGLGDPAKLSALIDRLDEFDFAIFISPNAVRHGLALVHARRAWPARVRIAGVGPGTGQALADAGHADVVLPRTRFNSEGLLAHEEFTRVAGKNIVIFRGHGGRELLATVLRERGARVEYAECYRRIRPAVDDAALRRLWTDAQVQVAIAASPDALRNLVAAVGPAGRAALLATPLVVVSPRLAEHARELGFSGAIQLARDAGDASLVAALGAWRASQNSL
ncbi:MAG: uroporphyrinogen-III synthase [Gammaproteobacteria bacterium]|nr:uroporphyrinogen-III synthase [Gammaproteobacteria bacterium]